MTAKAPQADPSLELLLAAGGAGSRDEWLFHVVNRPARVVPYDRASAWDMRGKPALLAVSGNAVPDVRSSFAASWSRLIRSMKSGGGGDGILSPEAFTDGDAYSAMRETTGGLSAVWRLLPEKRIGVLFERWGDAPFAAGEADRLSRLVQGYGMVWPARSGVGAGRGRNGARRVLWFAILLAVVLAMAFVRVPLRVAANCEVAARDPRLVSAPMDGVIDEVFASPGAMVKKGDALAVYDSRLMEEELKISNRQVSVVEAQLAAARARGFSDARYRGETALLEARLEQELARREALEVRYARRIVAAPADGMVQLDDARAWRGRPVATGQAILWLVDPSASRVQLWLPQDDRIDFDTARPIAVHLHALGGGGRAARLTYVSTFARPGPDGRHYFPAEAEWEDGDDPPPLGLSGTASLYGREASLGYWLFRRPMAWARRWLGV